MPFIQIPPGFASGLTTWDVDGRNCDFDVEGMREHAWEKIKKEEPLLITGSPMCSSCSAWQKINQVRRDPNNVASEVRRGMLHLDSCLQICAYLIKQG